MEVVNPEVTSVLSGETVPPEVDATVTVYDFGPPPPPQETNAKKMDDIRILLYNFIESIRTSALFNAITPSTVCTTWSTLR